MGDRVFDYCGLGGIVKGVKKRKKKCPPDDLRDNFSPNYDLLRSNESVHTLLSKLDIVEKKLEKLDQTLPLASQVARARAYQDDDDGSKLKVQLPDNWLELMKDYETSGDRPCLEISVRSETNRNCWENQKGTTCRRAAQTTSKNKRRSCSCEMARQNQKRDIPDTCYESDLSEGSGEFDCSTGARNYRADSSNSHQYDPVNCSGACEESLDRLNRPPLAPMRSRCEDCNLEVGYVTAGCDAKNISSTPRKPVQTEILYDSGFLSLCAGGCCPKHTWGHSHEQNASYSLGLHPSSASLCHEQQVSCPGCRVAPPTSCCQDVSARTDINPSKIKGKPPSKTCTTTDNCKLVLEHAPEKSNKRDCIEAKLNESLNCSCNQALVQNHSKQKTQRKPTQKPCQTCTNESACLESSTFGSNGSQIRTLIVNIPGSLYVQDSSNVVPKTPFVTSSLADVKSDVKAENCGVEEDFGKSGHTAPLKSCECNIITEEPYGLLRPRLRKHKPTPRQDRYKDGLKGSPSMATLPSSSHNEKPAEGKLHQQCSLSPSRRKSSHGLHHETLYTDLNTTNDAIFDNERDFQEGQGKLLSTGERSVKSPSIENEDVTNAAALDNRKVCSKQDGRENVSQDSPKKSTHPSDSQKDQGNVLPSGEKSSHLCYPENKDTTDAVLNSEKRGSISSRVREYFNGSKDSPNKPCLPASQKEQCHLPPIAEERVRSPHHENIYSTNYTALDNNKENPRSRGRDGTSFSMKDEDEFEGHGESQLPINPSEERPLSFGAPGPSGNPSLLPSPRVRRGFIMPIPLTSLNDAPSETNFQNSLECDSISCSIKSSPKKGPIPLPNASLGVSSEKNVEHSLECDNNSCSIKPPTKRGFLPLPLPSLGVSSEKNVEHILECDNNSCSIKPPPKRGFLPLPLPSLGVSSEKNVEHILECDNNSCSIKPPPKRGFVPLPLPSLVVPPEKNLDQTLECDNNSCSIKPAPKRGFVPLPLPSLVVPSEKNLDQTLECDNNSCSIKPAPKRGFVSLPHTTQEVPSETTLHNTLECDNRSCFMKPTKTVKRDLLIDDGTVLTSHPSSTDLRNIYTLPENQNRPSNTYGLNDPYEAKQYKAEEQWRRDEMAQAETNPKTDVYDDKDGKETPVASNKTPQESPSSPSNPYELKDHHEVVQYKEEEQWCKDAIMQVETNPKTDVNDQKDSKEKPITSDKTPQESPNCPSNPYKLKDHREVVQHKEEEQLYEDKTTQIETNPKGAACGKYSKEKPSTSNKALLTSQNVPSIPNNLQSHDETKYYKEQEQCYKDKTTQVEMNPKPAEQMEDSKEILSASDKGDDRMVSCRKGGTSKAGQKGKNTARKRASSHVRSISSNSEKHARLSDSERKCIHKRASKIIRKKRCSPTSSIEALETSKNIPSTPYNLKDHHEPKQCKKELLYENKTTELETNTKSAALMENGKEIKSASNKGSTSEADQRARSPGKKRPCSHARSISSNSEKHVGLSDSERKSIHKLARESIRKKNCSQTNSIEGKDTEVFCQKGSTSEADQRARSTGKKRPCSHARSISSNSEKHVGLSDSERKSIHKLARESIRKKNCSQTNSIEGRDTEVFCQKGSTSEADQRARSTGKKRPCSHARSISSNSEKHVGLSDSERKSIHKLARESIRKKNCSPTNSIEADYSPSDNRKCKKRNRAFPLVDFFPCFPSQLAYTESRVLNEKYLKELILPFNNQETEELVVENTKHMDVPEESIIWSKPEISETSTCPTSPEQSTGPSAAKPNRAQDLLQDTPTSIGGTQRAEDEQRDETYNDLRCLLLYLLTARDDPTHQPCDLFENGSGFAGAKRLSCDQRNRKYERMGESLGDSMMNSLPSPLQRGAPGKSGVSADGFQNQATSTMSRRGTKRKTMAPRKLLASHTAERSLDKPFTCSVGSSDVKKMPDDTYNGGLKELIWNSQFNSSDSPDSQLFTALRETKSKEERISQKSDFDLQKASEIMDLLEIYPGQHKQENLQDDKTRKWIKKTNRELKGEKERADYETSMRAKMKKSRKKDYYSHKISKARFFKKRVMPSRMELDKKYRVPVQTWQSSSSDSISDSSTECEETKLKQRIIVYMNKSGNLSKEKCKHGVSYHLPKEPTHWFRPTSIHKHGISYRIPKQATRSFRPTTDHKYPRVDQRVLVRRAPSNDSGPLLTEYEQSRNRKHTHRHDHRHHHQPKLRGSSDDSLDFHRKSTGKKETIIRKPKKRDANDWQYRETRVPNRSLSESSSSSNSVGYKKRYPLKTKPTDDYDKKTTRVYDRGRNDRYRHLMDEPQYDNKNEERRSRKTRRTSIEGPKQKNDQPKKSAMKNSELTRVSSVTFQVSDTESSNSSSSSSSYSSVTSRRGNLPYFPERPEKKLPDKEVARHKVSDPPEPAKKIKVMKKVQHEPRNYRQRLISADSKSSASYEKVNVKDFIDFLATLSRNTISTLTNKKKALKLYRNYLTSPRRR